MASLRKTIAIDLGTAQVLVYVTGRGIVLEEPSVIAVDVLTDDILAVGSEAKKLIGRTPGNVKAIMPMKDGVIADFKATERMLKYFLDKSVKKSLFKPNLLICVPSRATQVEKRAVLQAADNAGAHRVYLMEEPLAAALGAGVDISDAGGNLVIDVGGGTTDIAVVSMGQIVASRSVDVAGLSLDIKIKDYIRKRYGILIGDQKAEEIKIEAGLVGLEQSLEISGRAITSGLPQKIFVPVAEIYDCLRGEIDDLILGIKKVLEVTPPELASDIYEREIILTGGGANTLGFSGRIEEKLQIPVKIAQDPDECVIIGTSKALNWMESLDEEKNDAIKGKQKELERDEKLRRR